MSVPIEFVKVKKLKLMFGLINTGSDLESIVLTKKILIKDEHPSNLQISWQKYSKITDFSYEYNSKYRSSL